MKCIYVGELKQILSEMPDERLLILNFDEDKLFRREVYFDGMGSHELGEPSELKEAAK